MCSKARSTPQRLVRILQMTHLPILTHCSSQMSTPKSVNGLPAEVLGLVFLEFLEEEVDQEWRRQHPGRLICVCRLWKELVEGNSELWSRIDVTLGNIDIPMEAQPIRNKIRKAKRSPLALYIHCRDWVFSASAAVTRDVLTLYGLIKDHRWRTLSILNLIYLESFEAIFRHMVDQPQMCRFPYFRIHESIYMFDSVMTW
ncbi:hypothetical protein FRB94_013239 [Tulasnella sp. JGI-2019a]|nr:hypothetical protein FRB94_013239 [Tulasnella sp. JGI-2019a]